MKKGTRPPIVCVLGHVDHGKTTLLDVIRKTNVASREAGGITQGIGASVVTTKDGEKITFIDTPGHAAFSNMRSRGAKVADIAILVVDASDGVKPQTTEAVQLIKSARIPFIVAITKIDLPAANIEGTKGQLEKEGILFEGRGGDTPVVPLCAKEGKGIEELLGTISLVSEMHEIKADPGAPLEGVIIEGSKEVRGMVATIIVRNGTLKVGENINADGIFCKVRALFDYQGKSVKEIYPGEPTQILGFSEIPHIGSKVVSGVGQGISETARLLPTEVAEGELAIFLKAKDAGSLEALVASVPDKVKIIASGVGDVNESDILAAKAANARIFSFGAAVPGGVRKLAETEGVGLEKFEIIYEIIERLSEILKKGELVILGKAQILAVFPFNQKKIAGAKMVSGKISLKDNLILIRDEKEIGKARAITIRKQKEEVSEVKGGEEFGILFEPQLDFTKGDVLVSVAK